MAVVGAVGTLVGLVQIWPRVDLTPGQPLDTATPFSVPFVLTNVGYFPITNISADCSIRAVILETQTRIDDNGGNIAIPFPTLAPSQAMTLICPFNQLVPVGRGTFPILDVSLLVQFQPWIIPKTFRVLRRFDAKHGRTNWQWQEQPFDAPIALTK
ncbi:MAG: hypothetical protein WBD07_15675 [Vicinamibacterales bacterium]